MRRPRADDTLAQAGRAASPETRRTTWHVIEAPLISDETDDELGAPPAHAATAEPVPSRDRRTQRDDLQRMLRSRGILHQAILLREILGPPTALRDDSGQWS